MADDDLSPSGRISKQARRADSPSQEEAACHGSASATAEGLHGDRERSLERPKKDRRQKDRRQKRVDGVGSKSEFTGSFMHKYS
jgi:hypothetical protein